MNLQNDFYVQAILNYAPRTMEIKQPRVSGTKATVFVAQDQSNKRIFRFKSNNETHRNHSVSQVLYPYCIRVPRSDIYAYQDKEMEVYPYMQGRTLFEYLQQGMTTSELARVYADIAIEIKKLSMIPLDKFQGINNKDCAQVAQNNILNKTKSTFLANGVYYATQIMNAGPKTICHCDLNPRNILLDDNKHLSGILDLEAVSIANINFATAIAGYYLKLQGQDPNLFYKTIDMVIPDQLNAARIKVLEKVFSFYFSRYIPRQK